MKTYLTVILLVSVVWLAIGCGHARPPIVVYPQTSPVLDKAKFDSLRAIKEKEGFVGIVRNFWDRQYYLQPPPRMIKGGFWSSCDPIPIPPRSCVIIYANPSDCNWDYEIKTRGWPIEYLNSYKQGSHWRTHRQIIDSYPGPSNIEYLKKEDQGFDWFWYIDYDPEHPDHPMN